MSEANKILEHCLRHAKRLRYDIQDPMQTIFNAPMGSRSMKGTLGIPAKRDVEAIMNAAGSLMSAAILTLLLLRSRQ